MAKITPEIGGLVDSGTGVISLSINTSTATFIRLVSPWDTLIVQDPAIINVPFPSNKDIRRAVVDELKTWLESEFDGDLDWVVFSDAEYLKA